MKPKVSGLQLCVHVGVYDLKGTILSGFSGVGFVGIRVSSVESARSASSPHRP